MSTTLFSLLLIIDYAPIFYKIIHNINLNIAYMYLGRRIEQKGKLNNPNENLVAYTRFDKKPQTPWEKEQN